MRASSLALWSGRGKIQNLLFWEEHTVVPWTALQKRNRRKKQEGVHTTCSSCQTTHQLRRHTHTYTHYHHRRRRRLKVTHHEPCLLSSPCGRHALVGHCGQPLSGGEGYRQRRRDEGGLQHPSDVFVFFLFFFVFFGVLLRKKRDICLDCCQSPTFNPLNAMRNALHRHPNPRVSRRAAAFNDVLFRAIGVRSTARF